MATLVLGGLGALIGSSIGGPKGAQWGWAIGSTVGNWIDVQNMGGEGAKLTDRRYSGSQFGVPFPLVWGKARVGGQVVWVAEDADGNHLIPHDRSGGKKGPSSQYATATFAVAFCCGELTFPDGSSIERGHTIKKVWADDILIFDAYAPTNVIEPTLYSGTEFQAPDPTIVAAIGDPSDECPAFRGLVYAVFEDMNLSDFVNRIPNFSALIQTDAVDRADAISDLCREAGLLEDEVDVTGVTGSLTGLVITSREAPQDSLQALMTAFGVDQTEVDGTVKFIERGGAAVLTVDADDMGASLDGEEPAKYERRRLFQAELPGRVDVQYFDNDADLEQYTQSDVRQTADTVNSRSISLPLVLTATQAKSIAQRELDRAYVENETLDGVSLLPKYLELSPGDAVNLPTDIGMQRVRVTKMLLPPLGPIVLDCVLDGDNYVTQPGGGAGGNGGGGNYEIVPSDFVAWSGTELQDADQSLPGFYVAATGGYGWTGGTIFYSLDGGTTYTQGPSIGAKSVFGETTGVLDDTGAVAGQFDDTNTVEVDLTASEGTMVSVSDAQVDSGDNTFVIGDEILGVGTVSLVSPHVYQLSHIKRGLRGSVMSTHASSELVVGATSAVRRVSVPEEYVGESVKVKVLSKYQVLSDVTAVDVVIAARTPTDGEEALANLVVPYFISPVTVQASTTGTVSFTDYDASSNVPDGAVAVILEVEYSLANPDSGDVDAHVKVRKDSGSPSYVAARGRSAGSGDNVAGCNQVMVPITSGRHFEYSIEAPGFDNGCTIRLIGYWGKLA